MYQAKYQVPRYQRIRPSVRYGSATQLAALLWQLVSPNVDNPDVTYKGQHRCWVLTDALFCQPDFRLTLAVYAAQFLTLAFTLFSHFLAKDWAPHCRLAPPNFTVPKTCHTAYCSALHSGKDGKCSSVRGNQGSRRSVAHFMIIWAHLTPAEAVHLTVVEAIQ